MNRVSKRDRSNRLYWALETIVRIWRLFCVRAKPLEGAPKEVRRPNENMTVTWTPVGTEELLNGQIIDNI